MIIPRDHTQGLQGQGLDGGRSEEDDIDFLTKKLDINNDNEPLLQMCQCIGQGHSP